MKIGLLPFYIKLYDDCSPQFSGSARQFAKDIAEELRKRGIEVVEHDACRLEPEFAEAVAQFEATGCEAIATLHLAYSPSLEAIKPLAATRLPIVVIDTTPDAHFAGPAQLMPNHGIHGVQDFCNLLIRHGKKFLISAGHWKISNLLERSVKQLKAACMAYKISNCRVGAVGGKFEGMGDFSVPEGTFGMKVIQYTPQPEPTDAEVRKELELDKERFKWHEELKEETVIPALKDSLKIRRWIETEKLDAFTVCFLGITYAQGWSSVPFLECSKAISRGIGYAGEGDVLTAALSCALRTAFPETSFTEMFCPDWAWNRIFTSHMGEINLNLCAAKPLLKERPYKLSDTGNLVIATGCFKPGKAILTDLAPGPDGTFTLIATSVTYLAPEGESLPSNEGWFRVDNLEIDQFLERYSKLGGTHHLVASYNADMQILKEFAELMNWKFAEL